MPWHERCSVEEAMAAHLQGSFGLVSIRQRFERGGEETPLSPQEVAFELPNWLANPHHVSLLAGMIAPVTSRGPAHLKGALADAFRRGELRAVRVVGRPTVVERRALDRAVPLGPEAETPTFIDVRLIDANGAPVANERYRIRLASNEVREGRLDRDGVVRIDDVLGGDFTIEFPDRAVA